MALVDWFYERVTCDPNSGCHLWFGPEDGKGYGTTSFLGKKMGAHRLSVILDGRDIPAGLHVLHKCDTPACVNPEHLFIGTNRDNVDDYWRKRGLKPDVRRERDFIWLTGKRRYTKSGLPRKPITPGGRHGTNRVLSINQVREIRVSKARGVDLAKDYGVSVATVSKIRNGRLWAALPQT